MSPWSDSEAYAREAAKVESVGEALLLALLWWRRRGWTVRTQQPIGDYRVDLFIPEARVAIEVDSFEGHGSGAAMEHDAKRRNLVVAKGWAPLSFSVRQTFRMNDTLATILAEIERRMPPQKRPIEIAAEVPLPPLTDMIDAYRSGGTALLAALADGPKDGEIVLRRLP